jgi:hypothetical protein
VFPSGKKVSQLGEQEKQSIFPLKSGMEEYAVETGFCFAQMFSHEYIPNAELAWKYVHGEPLVRPEHIPSLQT